MTNALDEGISRLVTEIKGLAPRFAALIAEFEQEISRVENSSDVSELAYTDTFWLAVAYRNALIRLRLILEQNFFYLETLGVLATTRYVFETLVWLRLLERDRDYIAVFYGQAIDKQRQHLKAHKKKSEGEIAMFEELAEEEASLQDDAMKELVDRGQTVSADSVASASAAIMAEIDRKARRAFCVYAEQAKHNGYGFQAHLIREKALPRIQEQIDKLSGEQRVFDTRCPTSARKKLKARWNWKENAARVGMGDQYDFIYSYTSRLLHATPASIFTDEKNLEPQELQTFLEYAYVSMLEALELSAKRRHSDWKAE